MLRISGYISRVTGPVVPLGIRLTEQVPCPKLFENFEARLTLGESSTGATIAHTLVATVVNFWANLVGHACVLKGPGIGSGGSNNKCKFVNYAARGTVGVMAFVRAAVRMRVPLEVAAMHFGQEDHPQILTVPFNSS